MDTTDITTSPRRRREVTNSPDMEWAAREPWSQTEPLPDFMAAAILAKFSFVQVKRRMMAVSFEGKTLRFTHPNSTVVLNHNDNGDRFLVRYNPLEWREDPERAVLHVHTESGRYIESLPRKDVTPWFDPAATKAAIGTQRRIQAHARKLVEAVRAPDAAAELARETHNAEQLRAFATLPVPGQNQKDQPEKRETTAEDSLPDAMGVAAGSEVARAVVSARAEPVRVVLPACDGRGQTALQPALTEGDGDGDDETAAEFEDFADAIAELRARDAQNVVSREIMREAALSAWDDDD